MYPSSHPDWGCQRISDMLLRGPGPHGIVSTTGDGFEEPPAPGESNLDEGLGGPSDKTTPPEGGGS